jgi:ribosomal protein S18 acetylase RimI-like enzyme
MWPCLLSAAENEAHKRNCRYVHLNTHSFQAVEFYERNGYQKAGELTNLPPGHSKYLLWKELSDDEAGNVGDGFE